MTVLTRPVMEINLANLVENYQKLSVEKVTHGAAMGRVLIASKERCQV